MAFTTYTTEEFRATFPHARGHDAAVSYLSKTSGPFTSCQSVPSRMVPDGHVAVVVGYTNHSRRRQTARWAIIPAAIEGAE